ncbi:DNA mismatch repair endonuclease MutL [Paenibacillus psychroresistens]|uniref:DNA mismatch repair protein MutL n=1 Tax=Paenibacillus psychroresistens TaxID=1778678 RepID=A0A6B8RL06_9BACL|nr:DNA mismatch repair endonuclease MutL [Paenibacillus psychroresistens]QGQ96719.1 DNA mismatch repair endonuclease MutL [Paenibacillus psychroresistens]
MGIIHVLDDHIANQIAAGEVVERPSSVVKELVENSVDAGSTTIDVTIEEGGLQLIRVVDNGSGIEQDDCELAFFRHATSKINSGKELFQIRTLGFRGEALPSIAAVSKVECTTSTTKNGLGRTLIIEGGTVRSFVEAAARQGTDFKVRELFYNTPARLKYMKTIQTELGNVSDYIYRLAMAHPQIAFTLRHNDNLLLQTLGNGDLLQVIAAVYGSTSAKQLIPVQEESLDYTVQGYVSKPEWTRANRSGITTIINGRYIRNFALAQTILHAYHTYLPINRYPVAVLHITMDPSLLDVNVHPSKLEVRFSKEPELLACLVKTIEDGLKKVNLIPQGGQQRKLDKPAVVQEQMELYRPTTTPNSQAPSRSVPSSTALSSSTPNNYSFPKPTIDFTRAKVNEYVPMPAPERKSVPYDAVQRLMQPAVELEQPIKLPSFPELTPIGQLHGTYIVAQNELGLFLIDQHAAHERIHYEYYYEQFGHPADASQQLLVPITLDFTPTDAAMLKLKLDIFVQAGVYIEHFGGQSFIVRAYPHWFPAGEEQAIIEEMAEWILAEKKAIDLTKIREKAAIMCSCKASIKANQFQTIAEMEALLERLGACKVPYTCPHGRPIVVSFSTHELEKMFKRVM